MLLWVYLLRQKEFILTILQATRYPPSDVADTSSTFAVNQFLFRATYGGVCTTPRQVSLFFLCFLGLHILNTFSELSPIFLLLIGVRTPGHPSTVILPRMMQSKRLLSFFRCRLNYSTSTDRHSRVVQRCRKVDRYSTCWKCSKSGFGSMPVRKPSHHIKRCLSMVVSAEEVLMSQMRR